MADPARGAPDFWMNRLAGVDWLKTVLSTWTEYGPTAVEVSKTAVANDKVELFNKTDPALFRGGVVWVDGSASQATDYVKITKDGSVIHTLTFQTLIDNWQVYDEGDSIFINVFDEVNFDYVITLRSGLDYNTQMLIEYYEQNGNTPSVKGAFLYAEIPT